MSWYNNAICSLLSFLTASVNRESCSILSGLSGLISLIVPHSVLLLRFRGCTSLGLTWWFFSLSLKCRPFCPSKSDLFFFSLSWMADGLCCMISNNLIFRCLSISWKTSDQLWKSSKWIVILMTAIITLRTILSNTFTIILLEYKKGISTWLISGTLKASEC